MDATPGEVEWFKRADGFGHQGVLETVGFETRNVEEVTHTALIDLTHLCQTWVGFFTFQTRPGRRKYSRDDYWYALKQHHLYLKRKNCGALTIPGRPRVTKTYFSNTLEPCMHDLAEYLRAIRPSMINWDDRKDGPLALWNHIDFFPYTHTNIPDGYPMPVWKPKYWEQDVQDGQLPAGVQQDAIDRKLLHSGKYNTSCFNGHVTIGLNGLILGHTGEGEFMKPGIDSALCVHRPSSWC